MYRQYFDLRLNPFKIEPDPEFFWLGEKHQEGLATLQYGILENKGFLLLTGDVGMGKTVLIHQLRKTLSAHVKVAVIPDPGIAILDLYRMLSAEFQIPGPFEGKANFLIQFKQFLTGAYASQQQLLIIIDEAHRLSSALLDEIRVLSNIDYQNRKLINIFFVGQNEFNRMLMDRRNQAVRQRIAASYHLHPLDPQETQEYTRHRLKVAGSEKSLFTPEAFREIHRFSGGTPRLINIICDRALMTGYVKELRQIGAETIRECAAELDISLAIPPPPCQLSTISSERSAHPITYPVEHAAPEKSLLRNQRWLLAALAGTLGVLLYLLISIGPSLNVGLDDSAVAVNENTGVRHRAADESSNGRPASAHSEGVVAEKSRPTSDPKDSVRLPQAPALAAMSKTENIDPPAVVIRKRDPWEKTAFEDSSLESTDDDSTTAGARSAGTSTAREIVSASPGTVLRVQKFYLLFKAGSAELEDEAFEVLRQVSRLLSTHPNSRITLALFFDPTSQMGYTSKLLALRANCVKSYLTSLGVEANLTVVGRSAESVPEIERPPGPSYPESWSEIRIETGRKG
jgi:general secretion pathway protein A